ncbi:type II secretion system F family protein [Vreelandella utahensis]|uniref:type II secretion system F family protein n=1 Tax=Vreelandella halophila TaxID=86177 RepID=UPI00098637FB|nr:type II secretion system F family protein [Halomonas utahensis]
MSNELLFYSVLGAFAVFAMLVASGVEMARQSVPIDNRKYMDPLPKFLRLIWPLIVFFSHYVGERAGIEYLEWLRTHLRRSGLNYMMTPEQFVGLQCVASAFGGLVAVVIYNGTLLSTLIFTLLGVSVGAVLPFLKIKDRRQKREKEIIRALPVYLDFITMAVEAGMNINGAFMQAVEKGPDGPLKVELQSVLRDINAGMARIDALRAMADRLDIREITTLVSALVQAEHTGGSVSNALRIQGEQRRVERFQRAEKQALEAPVKLVFPLVAFIFPTTFVILFFPILMRFMYDM